MSASTETAQQASANPALPSDSQQAGPSRIGDGKAPEKTISCVSCRKRKLKCDRTKPKCGTCTRLRHDCEYPERRRNLGSKRRNMKELEARLAQVETQLVTESKLAATQHSLVTEPAMATDWDTLGMDMNLDLDEGDLLDSCFDVSQFNGQPETTSILAGDFFSQELLGLGLQEPLPPQDMMDELFALYFERFNPTMPMMHKLRFYASLDRAPNMRPPVCLRYAMWTIAATLSDKFFDIEDLLYQRARKYIEAEEMKGHGEVFISIYHAQTWGIIASYEAKKTYFSRSWMSSGRMIRMAHMLGLDRLDFASPGIKTILPPAKDTIELEERRRTFWAAFYADRWSSSGTGWPMIIDEKEIKTNLPCSEYAFDNGVEEPTMSLQEALTQDGASRISPFSGVIMSATLFGHNFQHLHRSGLDENPDDLQNGEFWKRHRRMDNVLSNTFMFLPDQLRLPAGLQDMNVIFMHLNIHCSAICLHQAAVATAAKYKLDQNFIRQSQARCLMAADEITNVMKLTCHVDPAKMHSWVGFCLYVAAGIYVKNQSSNQRYGPGIPNLEFILTAMRAIGRKHSITKHFIAQLELDIDAAGFLKSPPGPPKKSPVIPNLPINGILVDRNGQSMTFEDMQSFHTTSSSDRGSSEVGAAQNSKLTPVSDSMANESRVTSAGDSPDPIQTNPRDKNPVLIPDNYFPGAKTAPQWSEGGMPEASDSQGRPQSLPFTNDTRPFIEGSNNSFSDFSNPARIEQFIEGQNTLSSSDSRRLSGNPNTKSPSNDNHSLRFPYRTATPVQQTHDITGDVHTWGNSQVQPTAPTAELSAEWPPLSGFDEHSNIDLNSGGAKLTDQQNEESWRLYNFHT